MDLLFFSEPGLHEFEIIDIDTNEFTVRLPHENIDFTTWNVTVLNKTMDVVFTYHYSNYNLSAHVQADDKIISGSEFTVYVQTFSYEQAGKIYEKSTWTSKCFYFSLCFIFLLHNATIWLTADQYYDFKIKLSHYSR